jgi:hypothetical protein
VDAKAGALVRVDYLPWLFSNDVVMLDNTTVCPGRLGCLQLHEAPIVCLFALAQEHNIAFYATVSGVGVVEADVLPWKARQR